MRSIARIDHQQQIVQLFCDVAPGEELVMVRRTPLRDATRLDYEQFLRGKGGQPVAGDSERLHFAPAQQRGRTRRHGRHVRGCAAGGVLDLR